MNKQANISFNSQVKILVIVIKSDPSSYYDVKIVALPAQKLHFHILPQTAPHNLETSHSSSIHNIRNIGQHSLHVYIEG